MHYIPEDKIETYKLAYWVRGCNSLSKPHQFTIDNIGIDLYNQIVQIEDVPTITWETLVNRYNIDGVDHIKIDTEGHEYIILKDYFDMCKVNPALYADKITFEYNENSDKNALDELVSSVEMYDARLNDFDMVLTKRKHVEKAYVLYATESYLDTVTAAVASIKRVSEVPVMVYVLNSDVTVSRADVTINWKCDAKNVFQKNYIDRKDPNIYNVLIQRPLIVKDALSRANVVAYVDADSVATDQVDNIFNFFDESSIHPYFVEGVYNYLMIDGKGNIEQPILDLFGAERKEMYRQTGYFVAGQFCIEFLDMWWWMCNHPSIKAIPKYYAPFHEETVVNVLLWKNNYTKGLPYIYVNGSLDRIGEIEFTGEDRFVKEWVKIPATKDKLLFFHGEKKKDVMMEMINKLNGKKMRVLFLAPHLSTGGMPAFLLKRIEALQKFEDVEIYVVEYADVSPDYVVQKNKIKELVPNFYTLHEDKMELMAIIKSVGIDVVHIDEMAESLGANHELLSKLYAPDRTWRIVETCHNVAFNPDQSKLYHPDAYAFCTPYHEEVFARMSGFKQTIQFPIDPKPVSEEDKFEARMKLGVDLFKKHVVNVGLWTPGKNQGEGLEIARRFPDIQFHFVGNQAPNFASYWMPLMKDIPSNVRIWGERSDVDVFMKAADVFMFNSTWECNPLVIREAISYGLPIVARNLPQYGDMFTPYLQPMHSYLQNVKSGYVVPTDNTSEVFGDSHYNLYKSVITHPVLKQKALGIKINQHFIEKPFIEITGHSDSVFDVRFYDEDNNLYHRDFIKSNHWIRLSRGYYTKWRTEVWENDNLVYENVLNLEGRRVYICFDSASLGDNIAWMPYAEEFRKKHNCRVIVSTFKNFLFKDAYPQLEFVNPGDVVPNIYAQYKIGWFYNSDMEPALPNTVNLQECAVNILGLDYQEIKPKIAFTPSNNYYGKYVTIATNSTTGCKFWTKEGWQGVIDFLVEKGYDVINVSKERNPFNNCTQLDNISMEHTMDVIHHSEFFIGLSSGLSWLAWAMNKKVVMISNFTEDNHEFECIRITNKDVCHGCWNKPEYKFDKGDWNWCPVHRGTDRMFECHTYITPEMVIEKLGIG